MLTPGQLLHNRYRIVRQIATGGQSAVYLAEDTRLGDRQVAVKQFDVAAVRAADLPAALRLFQHTAHMLAHITHPVIAQVYDYFTDNRVPYLVMEYVEGATLEERLEAHAAGLPETEVVRWGIRLCRVLGYLHQLTPPIIFRDLKPGNILCTPAGQIKLVDFGIARTFKAGQSGDTEPLGTPGFAPPEQYGKGQSGPYSDVYALGVTLHRLVTGYDPAATPFVVPAADTVNPLVTRQLAQVIARATEIDAARRYQSMADMEAALIALPTAQPSSTMPVVGATAALRRFPAAPAAGARARGAGLLAKLACLAGLAGWAWQWLLPPPSAAPVLLAISATLLLAEAARRWGGSGWRNQVVAGLAFVLSAGLLVAGFLDGFIWFDMNLGGMQPAGFFAPATGDNGFIAVVAPKRGDRLGQFVDRIYLVNSATGERYELVGQLDSSRDPAWSPDGRRLAFVSNVSGADQIYTLELGSGKRPRALTDLGANTQPAWSPDGRHIAFVSDREGNPEIYTMNADGGNVQRVTHALAIDQSPAWSPDSRWLAFERNGALRTDVFRVRADGSQLARLTRLPGGGGSPAWSPDGASIAFVQANTDVHLMDTLGENNRRLARAGLSPCWSPDGRQVAYVPFDGGLSAVAVTGGPVIPLILDRVSRPAWGVYQ